MGEFFSFLSIAIQWYSFVDLMRPFPMGLRGPYSFYLGLHLQKVIFK